MKIHHFDLSNAIKDVELLADTTKNNLRRSIRKLQLRKKYLDEDRLKPLTDAKIWKYECKSQVADLTVSLEKCDALVTVLDKLQKDCVKTSDKLKNVLLVIKNELKKRMEEKKFAVQDMEAQMKKAKCGFWDALFTFGASCAKAKKLRNQLAATKAAFEQELAVASRLNDRMHYFDGLKGLSSKLIEESTGLLDTTKEFRNKVSDTKYELEQDFTDDEIDDQLGDEDFVNDFAEQLFESLDNLQKECDRVIADCKARKKRLTDALIWDKIGE